MTWIFQVHIMSGEVEIIPKNPIKRGNPQVLTGFAGAGFVGSTALMYIARQKEYELKAEVRSKYIPPSILLIGGEPTYPFRIYGDKKGEILIIVSEALVPPENSYPVANGIMKYLKNKNPAGFTFVEAMPFPAPPQDNSVYGFSFPRRDDLFKYGIKPISEGGVSGLNAVMLDRCLQEKIPNTTIITPTVIVTNIDYSASAITIDVLSKMHKLGVDTSALKKSIEMQQQIQQQSRQQQVQPQQQQKKKGFFDSLKR